MFREVTALTWRSCGLAAESKGGPDGKAEESVSKGGILLNTLLLPRTYPPPSILFPCFSVHSVVIFRKTDHGLHGKHGRNKNEDVLK